MRSMRGLAQWLAPSRVANAEIFAFRDLIRDRLAHEPYPSGYVVSARWQQIIDNAMDSVAAMDVRRITLFGMTMFDVGLPQANVQHLRASRAKYDTMHPELASIGESNLTPAEAVADCGAVTFSHTLDQAFSYYHYIVEGIGVALVPHVLEIGSGYGRFVRVLRLAGRAQRFTLVDLPQSLLFAFAFLRQQFPQAAMKIVKSRADIYPAMEQDFDFVFCPVQFVDTLVPANVDLLVNTYSLGEMPQGCVDHLMGCIHANLQPRYFYSLNSIFTNKNLHFDIGYLGEGNEIVLNLEPEWWPMTFEIVNSVDAGSWRSTVSTVLKRADATRDRLVADLLAAASSLEEGSDGWLGFMYFAALWCAEDGIVDRFLAGLRARQHRDGFDGVPSYSFAAIGEVAFLRRRRAAAN
jgi:putative sugar O-methyltransferase